GMVQLRKPSQPGLTEQRQMDRKGEGAQSRIGTNVTRCSLAPDVLLAGRQCQDPAAPAVGVDGLSDKTTRHLAHELFPACEQAEMRSPEIQRVTERLPLRRDDVRSHIARRANGAERKDLRYDNYEQCASIMTATREIGIVADFTKKIRVLHHNAGD